MRCRDHQGRIEPGSGALPPRPATDVADLLESAIEGIDDVVREVFDLSLAVAGTVGSGSGQPVRWAGSIRQLDEVVHSLRGIAFDLIRVGQRLEGGEDGARRAGPDFEACARRIPAALGRLDALLAAEPLAEHVTPALPLRMAALAATTRSRRGPPSTEEETTVGGIGARWTGDLVPCSEWPRGVDDEPVDTVVDSLAGFARVLTEDYEITDVLHDLTERVAEALGIRGAGVSLVTDGRFGFVTAKDEELGEVERAQEDAAEGPCADALATEKVVAVSDLAEPAMAHRWPRYSAAALGHGVHAVADIPMHTNGNCFGTITLYDAAPHRWTGEELHVTRLFSDIASSYVVNAAKIDQQRLLLDQLHRALESRVVIEQAKGIIAADRDVGVDDAFVILRKHANDHHASLRTIADAVVNLGLRP